MDRAHPGPGRARLIRFVFIVLVPCLVAQIAVRRVSEPYPAILLPAGASVVRNGETSAGSAITLLAEDAAGGQHLVAPSDLLDTVPSIYHRHLLRRGFGLTEGRDVRSVRMPFPGGGLALRFGRPLTRLQAEQTRAWLRSRLRRNTGIDAVRIHIVVRPIQPLGGEPSEPQDRALERRNTVELSGVGQ